LPYKDLGILCIDNLAGKIVNQSMSANLLEMSHRAEQEFLYVKPSAYLEERIAALPIGLFAPL
jgi:hypothetical protein